MGKDTLYISFGAIFIGLAIASGFAMTKPKQLLFLGQRVVVIDNSIYHGCTGEIDNEDKNNYFIARLYCPFTYSIPNSSLTIKVNKSSVKLKDECCVE